MAMAYKEFVEIASWVLLTLPLLVLVPTAIAVHLGRRAKLMARFLLLGIFGSLLYGLFAVFLVLLLFPQPESADDGSDLVGILLYFSSWAGGLAGAVTAPICVAVSAMVHWARNRTSPIRTHAPAN